MCYHANRGLRGFGCWGFFWPWYMACGISVPSRPQRLKSRILTTGSPGNSWGLSLLLSLNFTPSCSLIWKVMSSISTAHLNQLYMLLIAVAFMVILPGSSAGKESACNAGDPGSYSWVRKIHWRWDSLPTPVLLGFPGGSAGKESACNAGGLGSIPGWGRSPGEGNGYPPVFWPGEFHGLYSPWGCKDSDTTERLSLSWPSYLCTQALCTSVFCLLVSQFICV